MQGYTKLEDISNEELALRLLDESCKRKEAEQKLEEQQPKVEFYDVAVVSDDDYLMEEAAKIIEERGYGRNNLMKLLRDWKIFGKNNRPSQKFIENGCFRYKLTPHKGYVNGVSLTTAKGIEYIIKRLKKLNDSKSK